MSHTKELTKGILKENPVFIIMLGMCPTLGVTTQVFNAIGMGAGVIFVLLCSNIIISLLRKVIPDSIRIPSYIVIIASFVTIVEMLMHAFLTPLYSSLGIFIPLIVVNCIIFGRAESYASKNNVLLSIFDGVGIGIGFIVMVIRTWGNYPEGMSFAILIMNACVPLLNKIRPQRFGEKKK